MNKDRPNPIELSIQEMDALIGRGEQRSFVDQDYPTVVAILRNYFALHHAHQEKSESLLRLANRVFGHRTEKAKEVLKNPGP